MVSTLERYRECGGQTERREHHAAGRALGLAFGSDCQTRRSSPPWRSKASPAVGAPSSVSSIDIMSAFKKSLHAAEQKRADVARARRCWIREQGMLDPPRAWCLLTRPQAAQIWRGSEVAACGVGPTRRLENDHLCRRLAPRRDSCPIRGRWSEERPHFPRVY